MHVTLDKGMGTSEMHAGVPEKEATDAWHEVLTLLEEHKLNGKHFVGGVTDIAKIFDQIRRDLVYKTCKVVGMPTGVLQAYQTYIENLKVYNCVAGGMGTPYTRTCGIPQGCPLLHDHRRSQNEAMDHQHEKVQRGKMLYSRRRRTYIGNWTKEDTQVRRSLERHSQVSAPNRSQGRTGQELQFRQLLESKKLAQGDDVETHRQQHPCHK